MVFLARPGCEAANMPTRLKGTIAYMGNAHSDSGMIVASHASGATRPSRASTNGPWPGARFIVYSPDSARVPRPRGKTTMEWCASCGIA